MSFQILLAINILLLGVALLQGRPGLLVVAANLALALVAFVSIEQFGQPPTEAMLPASIFAPEALTTAAWVLALTTAVLGVSLAWPERERPVGGSLASLPKWLLLGAVALLLYVTLSTGTIVGSEYVDVAASRSPFSGGPQCLATSLILYELIARVNRRSLAPSLAFLMFGLQLVVTDYLKGNTGQATGFLITGAFAFYWSPTSRRQSAIRIASLVLLLALASTLIRGARASFSSDGSQSIVQVWTDIARPDQRESTLAGRLAEHSNGTQYAAHLLECIAVTRYGNSRAWRSLYLPIEYTFKPSFLVESLGLARSQEAAWELMDYFIHGGGIFVPGELYWNGGYLCVVVGFGLLVWIIRAAETRARASSEWAVFFCCAIPPLFMGLGYGLAHVERGFINGVFAALGLRMIWRQFASTTASRAEVPPGQPTEIRAIHSQSM